EPGRAREAEARNPARRAHHARHRITAAEPHGLKHRHQAPMDFEITPEHQQLVDSVRTVLAHECPTTLVRDIVENDSTPEQPWKSAHEFGWTSIVLPESLGGLELGFTAL